MGAPGCDDAPVIEVPLRGNGKHFTLIMPYYENPKFLRTQITHLVGRLTDNNSAIRLMLVDDGSPEHPLDKELEVWWPRGNDYNIHLNAYRLDVDVRWNWLAARNIGAHHAVEGWLMLTDIDHMLPKETLKTLVYGDHDPNVIYRFSRTGSKTHPHPNSWFMTREMYWKVGGYDEALSGYYGTDSEYRRRCAKTAPIRIMTAPLELHEHEGDSSTTRYLRKQPEDARGRQIIKARPKGWRPKVLSFPYHEVTL